MFVKNMSYQFQQEDYLHPAPPQTNQLPQGLNILTILSFIGSGVQILGAVFNFFFLPFAVKMMQEGPQPENDPAFKPISGFLKMSNDATLKQYDHRYIIVIVSLVGAGLCIYGAIQMRKRKKSGFPVYAIGEALLPLVTLVLIGVLSASFSIVIAAVFIILFAVQRKHFTQ
jgi:hypothetical protein